MSVNYDLYETPDLAKSGEEQPLHARVVLKGSYTAEEFVEQVTAFQHMPHAQVVGIIEAISKELRHLLLKGFSVELGDIGYFTLSLSVDKKVMESKELRSPSVSLKDVNFRVNLNPLTMETVFVISTNRDVYRDSASTGWTATNYIHRKCLASSLVPHYIVISTKNLNECFPVSLPKGKSQCECCLPTIIPVSL